MIILNCSINMEQIKKCNLFIFFVDGVNCLNIYIYIYIYIYEDLSNDTVALSSVCLNRLS